MQTTDVLSESRVACKSAAEANCKVALLSGPYDARKEGHSNVISLGIISPSHLTDSAEKWIQECNSHIASKPKKQLDDERLQVKHKLLFPDFPGAPLAFEKSLVIEPRFVQKVLLSEMVQLDKNNKYAYITGLLTVIQNKFDALLESSDRKPDVVLVILTDEMYETCHIVGDYHKKLRKPKIVDELQQNLFKDFDLLSTFESQTRQPQEYRILRSALKKIAMSKNRQVPIQIIRESTLTGEGTQNWATRSWNLCTGLYYKTGNLPWIMEDLDTKTCFLGISFFHKKSIYTDAVYSSMAHLFSNDFDSIVLRGEQVAYDEVLKAPILAKENACHLVEDAIQKYQTHRKAQPQRIVIHKTSRYREDELDGFKQALDHSRIAYDLVSIIKAPFRLVRWGQYPVPRGSYVQIDERQAFLYTKGFVPDLQTYPGSHIPTPFHVEKARGDSSIRQLCTEVLSLTKLNWNTADFCCGLPITIGFARSVGEVLKEFNEADEEEPSALYRFYM